MFRAFFVAILLFAVSCSHNSSQTWEDVKTAGRYMQRGVDTMMGKDYESRMLTSDEEFYGPYDEDFIPLSDADLKNQLTMSDVAMPQPKTVPGQNGLPTLDAFYSPPDALKTLFKT